ncbi:MAG: ABC transporter permease [Devosia sp.]|jgi:peptide/nickel transport system permease protein|uniref:ABC transporter permease n=1 Tax=Devosia sp. XGJD_8 TaxID=3391187 RepID=UPI001DB8B1C6|nr:ABC transporter permease [Alphaproteobacteria bacterium]MBU1560683.1 ABC transporter permease [Alphaproteobacteria bacterium]MBU2301933.1 ABC transporter permease [Alphaproteobacteria bacterium]MBU2368983.1 ABC transporter permease [Alphaproteobacteria bacterium]
MVGYIIQRFIAMLLTLVAVSVVAFAIIQLPPGDYLTSYIAALSSTGDQVDPRVIENLRIQYGLGEPFYVQYWKWITGILQGNFGHSFEWKRPVSELIWGRLGNSVMLEGLAVIVMWLIAVPIGIYAAVRKYSLGDYLATVVGFIGLAVPNFFFALIVMYLAFIWFGTTLGGLFSPEFENARWSLARIWDFLTHAWIPVLVLATAGTAELIRILRANLLDELKKPYVTTARAKGLTEFRTIMKYPVRLALNPLISTIGWLLPALVSGSVIVSVVMNLPTAGPMLLRSLTTQDMYLAGAIILLLSVLTVVGTLISDILLAWIDPRIRYGGK